MSKSFSEASFDAFARSWGWPTSEKTEPLTFPGGPVALPKPTAAQLHDSALAWLALAQQQVGQVRYLADCGDRIGETNEALDTLASQLQHIRRALTEAGLL